MPKSKPKKPTLTEDQRIAAQRARQGWALSPRGHEAAYLAGIDYKIDVMILRNLARRIMPAADFAIAVERSSQFGSVGDFWRNILLGRRRIVIDYRRDSHGWRPCYRDPNRATCCGHGCRACESAILCYIEKVTLSESLVWPPDGYRPPLTAEQLEAYLALPLPLELPDQVDPLGLAKQ